MNKQKIYKGSSKTLFGIEEDHLLLMSFEDGLRLPDKSVKEFSGKGVLCNLISACLMEKLDMVGIENHLIDKNNMRQQTIQFVDVYPMQVKVSNVASGRYVTDFDMEEGFVFDSPIIDFRLKNSEMGYPIINENQIYNFGWASKQEIKSIKRAALRINDFITGYFAGNGIRLVEASLEFGRVYVGDDELIILADEISPDTCKLWDIETNRRLCYEIATDNPDSLIDAYTEVASRMGVKTGGKK